MLSGMYQTDRDLNLVLPRYNHWSYCVQESDGHARGWVPSWCKRYLLSLIFHITRAQAVISPLPFPYRHWQNRLVLVIEFKPAWHRRRTRTEQRGCFYRR